MFIITGFAIELHHMEVEFKESNKAQAILKKKVKAGKVPACFLFVKKSPLEIKYEIYRTRIVKLDVTSTGILLFGDDLLNNITTSN